MKKLLIATAASFLATGALASGPTVVVDPPVAPPPPVAHYDWGGAYFGIGIGYANASQTVTPAGSITFPDASGAMISGIAGYNWQRGSMVYGAEAVLNFSNIGATGVPCTPAVGTCTTSVEGFAAIRGRVGVANDRTLIFATAGLASDARTYGQNVPPPISFNTRFNGGVVGIGFEQAMGAGDWTMRGDLEYYFYQSELVGGVNIRPNATAARLTVVRRF